MLTQKIENILILRREERRGRGGNFKQPEQKQ